jgi:hypothetical protein
MSGVFRLVILAIILGVAGGLLFPASGPAASGVAISVSVNPGAQDTMTCGWHEVCKPGYYPPYTALDWRNWGTNPPVYWRSWAIRSDGQTEHVAYGDILTDNFACYRISVWVFDIWGFDKGKVFYTHTRTTIHGTRFWITASPPLDGWFTSYPVGYSVAQDICSDFDGQHLHQYADYSRWQKAGPYPNAPAPETTYSPITAPGHLQAVQSWCWWC